jgi:hypothetical protein
MSDSSDDSRRLWDLDVRSLDRYAEVKDFTLIEAYQGEVSERPAPKKPANPLTRPNPGNPNKKVFVPSTLYTPGVINCVRGSPPRRVVPKKPR